MDLTHITFFVITVPYQRAYCKMSQWQGSTKMYVGLNVPHLLLLPDFNQNCDVSTDLISKKNPPV
jgi:hypothetical protein